MTQIKNRRQRLKYRIAQRLPGAKCTADVPIIEGSGTTLHDFSGNERHFAVSLNGLAESDFWCPQDVMLDMGIDFDSMAEAEYSGLPLGDNWTLEFLFTLNSYNYGILFCGEDASGNLFYARAMDDGYIEIHDDYSTTTTEEIYRNLDVLNHLVITYSTVNGSNTRQYFWNGAHVAISGYNDGTYPDFTTLRLGNGISGMDSYYWDGKLYSFKAYQRHITPDELFSYYTRLAKLGIVQSPTAWYDDSWSEQQIINPNDQTNTLPAQDLTVASAPVPTRDDVLAIHNGTDPGLYRSDSANSQWVKVEDNTVTIAY